MGGVFSGVAQGGCPVSRAPRTSMLHLTRIRSAPPTVEACKGSSPTPGGQSGRLSTTGHPDHTSTNGTNFNKVKPWAGIRLPGGPTPAAGFGSDGVSRVRAGLGVPSSNADHTTLRCVGGPSTGNEPDITPLQAGTACLGARLRYLEDRDVASPSLTRGQARDRDIARQELQLRTLAVIRAERFRFGQIRPDLIFGYVGFGGSVCAFSAYI